MGKIRAVLFDFTQTLVNSADGFRKAEKQAQGRIFDDLAEPSMESFLAEYRRIRAKCHRNAVFSRRRIWTAVYTHFNREPGRESLVEWERDYWETVASLTAPFPEATGVLRELAMTYELGLVTNVQGEPGHASHLLDRFPELKAPFSAIVVAGTAAVPAKPRTEPFERCLHALGLAADEAVFVGDDWRVDIQGAANAGIRPIWLQHRSVKRNWPEVETEIPVITSLTAVAEVIDALSCD